MRNWISCALASSGEGFQTRSGGCEPYWMKTALIAAVSPATMSEVHRSTRCQSSAAPLMGMIPRGKEGISAGPAGSPPSAADFAATRLTYCGLSGRPALGSPDSHCTLPPLARPLEKGKRRRWQFSRGCPAAALNNAPEEAPVTDNGRHLMPPRCAGLVGPYLCGKTTLLEALLFGCAATSRRAAVHGGNVVVDATAATR